ncbi:hypothetical protein C8J56DRAFT_846958 [Mycena floridula]|nr:hypothetical protein C8J56DRAFT_846958 [Mycena floridula]
MSSTSAWIASSACLIVTGYLLWERICKSRAEWIGELDKLGQPRAQKLSGSAIVCGGSIAGIVAARICADHFENVILVDPEMNKAKTRILQYNAAHAFLSLFLDGARRLWPTFDNEMRAAGGRIVPADLQLHYSGVALLAPYSEYPSGGLPRSLVLRRANAQDVLQKLLLQGPQSVNIAVIDGIVKNVQSTDKATIESLTVRKLDGTQISLNPALVVDCTGSTQAGLKWLRSAGFSIPDDIRHSYNASLRYVTLCFTVPNALEVRLPIPEAAIGTLAVYTYIEHYKQTSCFIALIKTDNHTMQLILGDACDGPLPRKAPEVVPFLSTFQGREPIPSWFLEVVTLLCESGNPSFDIIKIPAQSYVQYHNIPKGALPSNFIALGDANLQLNPVHGQGFAKSILNGLTLSSILHAIDSRANSLPKDFSTRYFKKSAPRTKSLWDATRLHDYGSSTCEPMMGETKNTGRFIRWFELKMISAATKDEEVASALWHVRHMLAAETVLFAPRILWKVLVTPSLF